MNTSRLRSSSHRKAGLPPGSLVHVGAHPAATSRLTLTCYDHSGATTHTMRSLDDILRLRTADNLLWVHCEGLDIADLLRDIGREFGVHPLILEDILNTHQRPKVESYPNALFLVLKILHHDADARIESEQLSILVLSGMVFTFRERQDELFLGLHKRLAAASTPVQVLGADYIAYVVMDWVVDNYFALTDTLDELIGQIEPQLLDQPQPPIFAAIQAVKRELSGARRTIMPLREVLLELQRGEHPLLQPRTRPYFRDVFDHVLRVLDTLDLHRDLINGQMEIYLSMISNRMNEIMKVLTLFASIFIPLTFLVGVYGMNFDHMPELHWKWAYPALWVLFFLVAGLLLVLFKKKKWL
ncbi:MAG: magnesium/cobalt transporter CorA [Desulfobulbus sp.]|jgi:magnesium transporter